MEDSSSIQLAWFVCCPLPIPLEKSLNHRLCLRSAGSGARTGTSWAPVLSLVGCRRGQGKWGCVAQASPCCLWGAKALELSLTEGFEEGRLEGSLESDPAPLQPMGSVVPGPSGVVQVAGLAWFILTPFASTNKATDVLCAIQLN